jgi:hypothetical protein
VKFTKTSYTGTVEILASDNYTALPITLTGSGTIKKGTPITPAGAAGTATTGTAGVLLNDVVIADNPNGSVIVKGVIDNAKAKAYTGIDLTGIDSKIPGIVLINPTPQTQGGGGG